VWTPVTTSAHHSAHAAVREGIVVKTTDIRSLEYLIKLQTELCNLAKPLHNEVLTYLIEMTCIEMADMLAKIEIDKPGSPRRAGLS
jgi:hypothetical protein